MMEECILDKVYGRMPVNWQGSVALLLASVVFDSADNDFKYPCFIKQLGLNILPTGKSILLFFLHSVSGQLIISPINYSTVEERYYARSQFKFFRLVSP